MVDTCTNGIQGVGEWGGGGGGLYGMSQGAMAKLAESVGSVRGRLWKSCLCGCSGCFNPQVVCIVLGGVMSQSV